MKKICVLLCMLGLVQLAGAVSDIGFSNGVGGFWSYTPSINSGEGVFSFSQPITVDDVLGAGTDALVGASVYIPNLAVSNLTLVGGSVYKGTVTPETAQVVFKDAADQVIMTGDLVPGGVVVTVGTTAMMYSDKFDFDITITNLPNSVNSAFINSLKVGWGFDFALTLQDSSLKNGMAAIILQNQTVSQGSTLSGDMVVIPEPASLAMLGLGSLMLWKRKR